VEVSAELLSAKGRLASTAADTDTVAAPRALANLQVELAGHGRGRSPGTDCPSHDASALGMQTSSRDWMKPRACGCRWNPGGRNTQAGGGRRAYYGESPLVFAADESAGGTEIGLADAAMESQVTTREDRVDDERSPLWDCPPAVQPPTTRRSFSVAHDALDTWRDIAPL